MKTYKINTNSNKRAVFIAIILYPVAFHLMTLIPQNWPDWVNFGIISILFLGPMYPVTLLSRGKIQIELTEELFRTIWVRRFFLSRKPDIELHWDRIIDYVHQEDRGLDSFRLNLTNNQQFKFYRYTFYPQKDEFSKFLTQFPNFIQKINLDNSAPIELGKTEFQTRSFKRVLIGLTILATGLLIYTLLNPNSGTRWPTVGVIFSGILYYWIQATRRN